MCSIRMVQEGLFQKVTLTKDLKELGEQEVMWSVPDRDSKCRGPKARVSLAPVENRLYAAVRTLLSPSR